MKKIIATLSIVGLSLFGDVTPNLPHNTPEWADENDLQVARTIMGESMGESLFGQALVGDVIYTRSMNRGLTPYEVVIEPNQFAGKHYKGEVTDHVWKITLRLKLGLDVVKHAEFDQFRAHKLTDLPNWGKDFSVVGNHTFFREE